MQPKPVAKNNLTPATIEEFKKHYGWKASDLLGILGPTDERSETLRGGPTYDAANNIWVRKSDTAAVARRDKAKADLANMPHNFADLPEHVAQEAVDEVVKEYMEWFRKEPLKTHVFPLGGMYLHYHLAKGIAKAMGVKARLTKIPTARLSEDSNSQLRPEDAQKAHALGRKLGIEEGSVIHDYIPYAPDSGTLKYVAAMTYPTAEAFTLRADPNRVQIHQMPLYADRSGEEKRMVPVLGELRDVRRTDFVFKDKTPKDGSAFKFMSTARAHSEGLSERKPMAPEEQRFVESALQAAGFAMAKRLMAGQPGAQVEQSGAEEPKPALRKGASHEAFLKDVNRRLGSRMPERPGFVRPILSYAMPERTGSRIPERLGSGMPRPAARPTTYRRPGGPGSGMPGPGARAGARRRARQP